MSIRAWDGRVQRFPLLRWERLLHCSIPTSRWGVLVQGNRKNCGRAESHQPSLSPAPAPFQPQRLSASVQSMGVKLLHLFTKNSEISNSKILGSRIFEHSALHDVSISTREALNSCPSSSPRR